MRGIPIDSILPLFYLELFLYENRAGPQGEVKLYAAASVNASIKPFAMQTHRTVYSTRINIYNEASDN